MFFIFLLHFSPPFLSYFFNFGSNASRRPSPNKFSARIITLKMTAGMNSLYGYVLSPLNASEHIEPRLVSGADTPTPTNERNDSRKIADGICKNVVVIICPIQFGSRCFVIIRVPFSPSARAAVTYSCCFNEESVHG